MANEYNHFKISVDNLYYGFLSFTITVDDEITSMVFDEAFGAIENLVNVYDAVKYNRTIDFNERSVRSAFDIHCESIDTNSLHMNLSLKGYTVKRDSIIGKGIDKRIPWDIGLSDEEIEQEESSIIAEQSYNLILNKFEFLHTLEIFFDEILTHPAFPVGYPCSAEVNWDDLDDITDKLATILWPFEVVDDIDDDAYVAFEHAVAKEIGTLDENGARYYRWLRTIFSGRKLIDINCM